MVNFMPVFDLPHSIFDPKQVADSQTVTQSDCTFKLSHSQTTHSDCHTVTHSYIQSVAQSDCHRVRLSHRSDSHGSQTQRIIIPFFKYIQK